MFTEEQRREFKELGFLTLRDAIDESVVEEARTALQNAVPSDREEYESLSDDPDAIKKQINQIQSAEPFNRINEALYEYADALVGGDELAPPGDGTQIALRYPEPEGPHDPASKQPRDLHGHLDGYRAGYELGDKIEYATVFGIVYLDRVRPMGGGFTVWPGSHWNVAEYFETHSLESGRGGIPGFTDEGEWDYDTKRHEQFDPFEITGDAGTVILAHYKLEHTGGVNLGDSIRMSALRRFRRADAQEDKRDAASNIWKYWPAMQDVEVSEKMRNPRVTDTGDTEIVDIVEKRR